MPMRRFHRPTLWLSGWWVAIGAAVVICLLPMPPLAMPTDHFDKIEHAVGHALLAAYAAMLFGDRRSQALAMLALVGVGLAIEGLQALLPWRSADAADVLANVTGTALGWASAALPSRRLLQQADALLDRRLAGRRNPARRDRS